MAAWPVEYDAIVAAPFGQLGIVVEDDALRAIDLLVPREPTRPPSKEGFAAEVCAQLTAYFRNPRHCFALPIVEQGTAFQRRVWRGLRGIAPGVTLSYGELAERLGSGARAVGGACAANPVPVVVPCHRVVGRDGPGGFMGGRGSYAMSMKFWLLAHERV